MSPLCWIPLAPTYIPMSNYLIHQSISACCSAACNNKPIHIIAFIKTVPHHSRMLSLLWVLIFIPMKDIALHNAPLKSHEFQIFSERNIHTQSSFQIILSNTYSPNQVKIQLLLYHSKNTLTRSLWSQLKLTRSHWLHVDQIQRLNSQIKLISLLIRSSSYQDSFNLIGETIVSIIWVGDIAQSHPSIQSAMICIGIPPLLYTHQVRLWSQPMSI